MVMEASPSPQSVGREFVRQYYTLLNKAPSHLHRFYNNYSSFVHGGLDAPNRETPPVIGQKQIHNRIQQLNFRDCHAKISQVDSQATLGNGVVVQVTGELSNGGAPMRRFTQTFVLAAQSPKKYYVHNDIFRYQDIVLSDEEGEGSTRSEGEDEETRGYFPPPPTAFPSGVFPPAPIPPAHPHVSQTAPLAPTAPPMPPQAAAAVPAPAAASVPAQTPHLNGHPAAAPIHDDSIRHLGATLQATSISSGPEVESINAADSESASTPLVPAEPEPEPEPEREPTPPPQTAAPPVPPEPKTYANLLKSGGPTAHAQPAHTRSSPPQSGTAASGGGVASGGPALGGGAGAEAPRPRPQRPPKDAQPPPDGPCGGPGAGIGGGAGAAGGAGAGAGAGSGARRYSDSHQLFLGNLPHNATEEELRALFGRFGAIAELRVHSKPAAAGGARHPNYGFITYEQPQAAHNCLHAAPLYFPPDAPDAVKLNVEEKKARGGRPEAPRGGRGAARGPPSHRPPFPSRPSYRR